MKLCIDCKHIRDAERKTFEKCALLARGPNPVDGEPDFAYCQPERQWGKDCGPEGLLWEPKEAQ